MENNPLIDEYINIKIELNTIFGLLLNIEKYLAGKMDADALTKDLVLDEQLFEESTKTILRLMQATEQPNEFWNKTINDLKEGDIS